MFGVAKFSFIAPILESADEDIGPSLYLDWVV